LFYRKYRLEYPSLNSQLTEIAKSFIERRRKGLVSKTYPEVRSVSIRFTEKAWDYE
jgi:hypothetical protein